MSEKTVLVDGHSILNRAFYGLPDLTNAEGLHTNAVYGFLTILFRFLEEEEPTYLTVAFDAHAPTFRHEMYEDYKGNRKPMVDELREQVPVIKEVLTAMGIRIIEQEGLEADDILGTLSRRFVSEDMDVSIISGDRDLLQLATDRIKIRIPKTKQGRTEVEDYYAADVEEKYHVTPTEFIDVKALMGDTSDNIPGLPGVGEKTATAIIEKYHSIENAHAHAQEVEPPRASKALIEHWDLAVLSKELATIRTDAEVAFDLSEAKLGNIYTEEAYAYFQRLQFKNLLSRFEVSTPANPVEDSFHVITDKKEAESLLDRDVSGLALGAALHLSKEENLLGIALTFSLEETDYLDLTCGIDPEWAAGKVSEFSAQASRFCMFDLKAAMRKLDIIQSPACFDALVAAYLLNPLNSSYDYATVAQEQLDLLVDEKSEDWMKTCYESYTAYEAYDPLQTKLKDAGMEALFTTIEMPLVFTLHDMEKAGMKVEKEALREYGEKLGERIEELEKEIYTDAGEEFNLNSPKQLGKVLFEDLKIPGGKKTKTGYSTAADVLEKLAPDYPIVGKILEYRQYAKLKSTYADGLAAYIAEDGRIHTKFNQTVTATGRLSSTEPNLQNIPIRMELGREIRKVFVPADGYVFVDADYSQIELRILAHCSGDEQLIEAYKGAKDIHRLTASQVFHVPFDEVTPLMRRNAKAVNFGIIYGISSFGLSQDLSITRAEASHYIDEYFEAYPGIKAFLDEAVSSAKKNGYVTTLFGRRRPVPELSSSNYMQRSFGERVAMNAPIQGTAADIIKIAMNGVRNRLAEEGLRSRLVLQVHDELLVETYEPEEETVKAILKEEMEQAADLKVPLVVDMHTGKTWYDAK